MSRLLARLGVVLTAAVALVAGGGSVAVAHVSVHADEAMQGGSAEISFRVPTETDTSSTVTVAVAFPADAPIAEVAVLPLAGWTYQVTRTAPPASVEAAHGSEVSEVVSAVEWHATGPGIKPGEYEVFRIAAGMLPRTERMVFKVVQTYDDGQVQRWIDEPVSGEPEPAHPAPVLALSAAGADGDDNGSMIMMSSTPAAPSQAAWWTAMAVALLALGVALVAVVIALPAGRRRGGDTPEA
ncbi:YcnI family protein [Actinophytocola sp.]|uniref:YcnI family copper-binding membrane protein n=1 Tax=Actinophytocola sp. TaxID=1872138 RepID=UPI002D459548|nr:YcnI family protein [Actinophytocola sp.]HYQ62029.1 YcnI family protein [Actinophytocola sp.]